MTQPAPNPLSDLCQHIASTHDLEEVQALCFQLGIDYDELAGQVKTAKVRSLLVYLGKRQRLDALIETLAQTRPDTFEPVDENALGALYAALPSLEDIDAYLARAVATFETRMYRRLASPPPDQPYKFLYAFEIEDAPIFFGRNEASKALHQVVLKDRLTVLHARSGAGKTSLLNAGLSPSLIREGRLPIYTRAYDDPVVAVKRTIAPASAGPWPESLAKLSLYEFLGLACGHLSRDTKELVVVLDQFEEFFIFWPQPDHRQPFVSALADCYEDKALPVRFVIGIRKDYYSDLGTFQYRLPCIFHNEYLLGPMSRQEAQAAIIGPVTQLGRPVTYDQVLLNGLLDDLVHGGTELPHLQIICTQLYETLDQSKTVITLDAYEGMGRAEGVLGSYLNDVLDRLPGKGGTIAKEVLKELVSSEATKRVLDYEALATRVEAEDDKFGDILAQLVDARLLCRDEVTGEIAYELAHDHLAAEIATWISQEEMGAKFVKEMLRRRLDDYGQTRLLIPVDALKLIHERRDELKRLSADELGLLLRSALAAGYEVAYWFERARAGGVAADEIARDVLDGDNSDARVAAVQVLGQFGGEQAVKSLIAALQNVAYRDVCRNAAEALHQIGEPAVEPLIATLKDEEEAEVQFMAAWTLGKIGEPAVEPLIIALKSKAVRWGIAKALGDIGDERAVDPLIQALNHKSFRVRRSAALALGQIGDERAVEPLIAALKDRNDWVRQGVAEALGWVGSRQAVESLVATLKNDEDVQTKAAEALGEIGDERAIKPLIAALKDRNEFTRSSAALALGQIGDERAVEPLIAALKDRNNWVRENTASALGKIGDERAVDSLIAALKDDTLEDDRDLVRQKIAEALRRIGTSEAWAALREYRT